MARLIALAFLLLAGSTFAQSVTTTPAPACYVLSKATGTAASPLATLSGVTSGTFTLPGGAITIPAGTLQPGSWIHVRAFTKKTGTTATWTINGRLGTNGNNGDNVIFSGSLTATQVSYFPFVDAVISAATTYIADIGAAPGAAQTVATFLDRTTAFNTASANIVSFDIAAGNVSDSYSIISYLVQVCQ